MLDWFEHLDTELVWDLLERWPALEELQKVPPAKLRTFFRKHYCRDEALIERGASRKFHPQLPSHDLHSRPRAATAVEIFLLNLSSESL